MKLPGTFRIKVGQVIGRLTILSIDGSRVRCSCKCGNQTIVFFSDLKPRRRKSCGCLQYKGVPPVHGHTAGRKQSATYRAWSDMKTRCSNRKWKDYKNYGGRGIQVCPLWKDSFEAFLSEVGERPGKKYSLERIDNSKGYEPGNVRWATRVEQNRNRRGVNWVIYRNKKRRLIEIAEEHGMDPELLRARVIGQGMAIEKALTRPNVGGPAKFFTYKGATHYLKEWSQLLGIPTSTINSRMSRAGMTFEEAVKSPIHRGIRLRGSSSKDRK